MNSSKYSPQFVIDLLIRIAMLIIFGTLAGAGLRSGLQGLAASDMAHPEISHLSTMLSVISVGVYNLVVAFLYVLRLRPVSKFAGILPAFSAVGGGFLMMAVILLKPNENLSLEFQIIACVMIVVGNLLAALILTKLGRSFSILPEGRRVVMRGPYSLIRHPLYLAEEIATLGVMINYFSLWAVLLVVAQFILQLARIYYEEKVLTESFPDYAAYAKKTWRLIPYVY